MRNTPGQGAARDGCYHARAGAAIAWHALAILAKETEACNVRCGAISA
jgi:hypothetical protein